MRVHPDIIPLLLASHCNKAIEILPSLRKARVSSPCDPFQHALSLSTQLRQLELDLGFKTKDQTERACHFLQQVFHTAPELEKLSIRGSASLSMNSTISSMLTIHTLSLHLGNSLTAETLLAVTRFPLLSELDIHAGHLDVDSLTSCLSNNQSPTFPSLQKLHLRAPANMIELFMQIIPGNSLKTVRIEAEDPAVAWSPIFKLLCGKAANTLINLTLEHHIELDDIDATSGDPNLSTNDNNSVDNELDMQIPFSTLKDLSAIRGLRRLILDFTLPPAVCDQDVETMADWWSSLEHLDLGSASTDRAGQLSNYPMTFRSLVACAQKMPNLISLILPANANIAYMKDTTAPTPSHNKLTRITLGHPSTPDPVEMAQRLHQLFPSLTEVDGLEEHEEEWTQIQTALNGHCSLLRTN